MTMDNLGWGFQIMGLGMGTVFLMLILLMVALILLNRTDRQPAPEQPAIEEAGAGEVAAGAEADAEAPSESQDTAWMTIADASGLNPEQIAAVAVAVATHRDVRRKQAAPVNRVHAPGSRLWASRWVSMGRDAQMRNTKRR